MLVKKLFVNIFIVILALVGVACSHPDKLSATNSDESDANHILPEKVTVTDGQQDSNDRNGVVEKPTPLSSEKQLEDKKTAKRALIIGIGEQQDKSWVKINGDKDVPYVQAMLTRFGYGDITTLVNKQATKAGIVSAFKKLTAKCAEGDMVYIHFSGHGQQVTDVNGDEGAEDTLDESWIPYDAYLKYGKNDKGEKHLIDDEINVLLTDLRNKVGVEGKILVVVDACHSGGSTRGEDIDEVVRGVNDDFVIPISKRGAASKTSEKWMTLSACKDFQLNQEVKNPQVGKLTYALYSISKEGKVTEIAVQRFMQQYRARLPQSPVLTGESLGYELSDFFE